MAENFTQFRSDLRDWANRDSTVITDPVIRDCMNFAADTCYRELRVPPLEATVTYFIGDLNPGLWRAGRLSVVPMGTPNALALFFPTGTIESQVTDPANYPEDRADPTPTSGQAGFDVRFFFLVTGVSAYIDLNPALSGINTVNIPIPADTTEFLYLRSLPGGSSSVSVVINEKVDIRTFHDTDSVKTSGSYWARQGNNILLGGNQAVSGNTIQLHYYRRLPAVDARFSVTTTNMTNGRLTQVSSFPFENTTNNTFNGNGVLTAFTLDRPTATLGRTLEILVVVGGVTQPATSYTVVNNTLTFMTAPAMDSDIVVSYSQRITTAGTYRLSAAMASPPASTTDTDMVTVGILGTTAFFGREVPNWLRDENRKSLLFGSLYHIFDYLDDAEQAGVYREKFAIAIGELNDEEKRRDTSGANVSINYTSYLL